MQFDGHSTNFDIISDIDFWAGTTSTTYPTEDKTRNINLGYDRVVSLILQADGRWQWDDANASDIPTGTINLVSGTQKYDLGTGVSTFLRIVKVACKDTGGTYRELEPMSLQDFEGIDVMDATRTGTPTAYFKMGDYLVLNVIPNYSSTSGLKLYTQKNVSYFTTSDTTKEPGFAAPFHRLLSLYPAKDYCSVNDMPKRLSVIIGEIEKLEASLVAFYSQRSRDERPRLRIRKENYGSDDAMPGASSKTLW